MSDGQFVVVAPLEWYVFNGTSTNSENNTANVELTLINADTNSPIAQLVDNETVYLDELSASQLSIEANVVQQSNETVLSVLFLYGLNESRVESVPPYALGGDFDGDYTSVMWLAEEGQKTITVRVLFSSMRTEVKNFNFWIVKQSRPQGFVAVAASPPVDQAPVTPSPVQKTTAPVISPPTTPSPVQTTAPVIPPSTRRPVAAPVALFAPVTSPENSFVEAVATEISQEAGTVRITGELRKWHKVTLAFLNGPVTNEEAVPNPFTDYRLDVTFTNGLKTMIVPGYYAADGNAANTGASSGRVWHCHFSPPLAGKWTWKARFLTGPGVSTQAVPAKETKTTHFDGTAGSFTIAATNKTGRDLRGKGLLEYVNKHHLRFAETGEWFLKAGSDSPENFLAYVDFDNTHVQDYQAGDPLWKGGKGKGIIGAVNYLSDQGMNAFSFLTFSLGGDDKNVFPHVSESDMLRIDVSKTAQWEVVLEHGDRKGMFLHFKTQETENNDILDGGELGPQRKLYYRELIAVSVGYVHLFPLLTV
jgi:Domain of unknown function (DUF5060)